MAKLLDVLEWPHETLTKVTKEVTDFGPIAALAEDMFYTMEQSRGIGLAANQVGQTIRMLTMNVNKPLALINPVIVKASKETYISQEGCLSFPGVIVEVERSKWVKVSFRDQFGEPHTLKLRKLESRCFLHELDHLNGKTMLEVRVSGTEPQKRA